MFHICSYNFHTFFDTFFCASSTVKLNFSPPLLCEVAGAAPCGLARGCLAMGMVLPRYSASPRARKSTHKKLIQPELSELKILLFKFEFEFEPCPSN